MGQTDMNYRIGTVSPNRDASVQRLLLEGGVPFAYPRVNQQVRVGKDRRRQWEAVPILPGVFFVGDIVADDCQLLLKPEGLRLWWMRNHASEYEYAVCRHEDIEAMITWMREQGESSDTSAPLAHVRREPGTILTVLHGPFAGCSVTLRSDDGVTSVVEMGPTRIPLNISSCSLT